MNSKQNKGLIFAAVIFVVTGVISVITNTISSKISANEEKAAASGLSSFMEELYGNNSTALADIPMNKDFIAVVPVEGTIQASDSSSGLYGTTMGYNHNLLMEYVDRLINNPNNKGMILRMNTPGGTVYEADELYLKIKEYKEKTERPIWVYMESSCCSGGVYIAAAADEQYANRITTTGSIGVIISNYDMSGLYEKLGIKEENIVSAKNKDMGSSGKSMTSEQRAIYQAFVDEYYERFVEIVAEGRGMTVDEVKALADGRIYTATQALDNGLIDGIKTAEEFDDYVKEQSGVNYFYEPSATGGYLASILGSVAGTREKSEAEVLVELMNNLGSGVPMYYAEPFRE